MTQRAYNQQELNEAIIAGERLLQKLDQVLGQLKGAQGWGFFDMLGGGMFSTFMKRDKMKQAEYLMHEINEYAMRFKKELGDLNLQLNIDLTSDRFLGFADYFFDNFFVDFMVQSKIHDGLREIEDFYQKVEDVVYDLKRYRQ